MTQTVYIGTNAAPQTGLYGGSSPIDYEEQSTGSNGFGVRMTASRVYKNWFTQPFTTSSRESTEFASGHLIVFSVSNPNVSPGPSTFTHHKLAAGSYDTDISAMFARIAALAFSTSASGTYGGLTQPYVVFIYEHEVDSKGIDGKPGNLYYSNGGTSGTKDTPADYINAWNHLRTLWNTAATTAGVSKSVVQFCLCFTSYGFSVKRVDQYYPGAGQVDILGSDPYLPDGAGGGGTDNITDVAPYAIKWLLPVGYPEFNAQGLDSSSRASAFTTAFNTLANETRYSNKFVCIWNSSDSANKYNFQKSSSASAAGHAFPLTHAAIATGITTCGGNPIISSAGQGLPANPTLTGCSSNSAGTSITLTWANPPSGDNVTGWNVYLAAGTTTTLTKIASGLAAGTRSYTFTALADGTPIAPGQPYSCDVVAINSAGNSGYGLPTATGQITTQQPGGTSAAPVITAQTAVPDSGNPQQIDIVITATSPGSYSLSYSHVISGPNGFTETLTGSSVSVTGDPGSYTDTVTVTDSASPPNSTTTTLSFSIAVPSSTTTGGLFQLISTGTRYADSVPIHRANAQRSDDYISALEARQSQYNAKYQLAGCNFAPDSISGSVTAAVASGYVIWMGFTLEDTSLTELLFATSVAQNGTGAVVGVHDATGALLPDFNGTPSSGTAVDAGFQSTAAYGITVPLGLTVARRTWGETLFAVCYFPSGMTTYPTFRCSGVGGGAAQIGQGTTTPLWGILSGQSAYPNPVPFSSWTSQNQIWVGCQ